MSMWSEVVKGKRHGASQKAAAGNVTQVGENLAKSKSVSESTSRQSPAAKQGEAQWTYVPKNRSNEGDDVSLSPSNSASLPGSTSASPSLLQSHHHAEGTSINEYKLFVGGLCYATGHESLRKYFSKFGEVSKAQVMYNRTTKASRGFGFVLFSDPTAVEKVLMEGSVHVVDGSDVEVKRCRRENFKARHVQGPRHYDSSPAPPNEGASVVNNVETSEDSTSGDCINEYKVFVGGLSYVTGNDVLRQYFSKFGEVVSAEVMYNRSTRASRGFGFILFKNATSVDQVLQQGHLHVVHGNHVEVKRCRRSPSEISNIRRFGKYSRPNGAEEEHQMQPVGTQPYPGKQTMVYPNMAQQSYPAHAMQQPYHQQTIPQQQQNASYNVIPTREMSPWDSVPGNMGMGHMIYERASSVSPVEMAAHQHQQQYGSSMPKGLAMPQPQPQPYAIGAQHRQHQVPQQVSVPNLGGLSLSSRGFPKQPQAAPNLLPPSVAAALAVVDDMGDGKRAKNAFNKTNDVHTMLASLNLSKYADMFSKEEITDLETLSMLTDDDLQVLGVPKGPRVKILEFVSKSSSPSGVQNSASSSLPWLESSLSFSLPQTGPAVTPPLNFQDALKEK